MSENDYTDLQFDQNKEQINIQKHDGIACLNDYPKHKRNNVMIQQGLTV